MGPPRIDHPRGHITNTKKNLYWTEAQLHLFIIDRSSILLFLRIEMICPTAQISALTLSNLEYIILLGIEYCFLAQTLINPVQYFGECLFKKRKAIDYANNCWF